MLTRAHMKKMIAEMMRSIRNYTEEEFARIDSALSAMHNRMDALEKHYTQYGEPHRQNIEKAIEKHKALIKQLEHQLKV